jgi:hypothetical protein
VEHPCNRCGAAVDNNTPFCPACEAPQIRFEPREDAQDAVRLHPATIPPTPVVVSTPGAVPYHAPAAAYDRRRWLRAAIYAGVIGFILSLLPTGPILALPVAGWLAVSFYTRMTRFPLRSKEGFRIGALAGLITFGMMVVIGAIAMTALSVKGELRQTLLEAANRVHTINPDLSPDQLVNYMLTPAGMTVGIVFTGLVLVVLAGFGGLISTLVSGRRLPR